MIFVWIIWRRSACPMVKHVTCIHTCQVWSLISIVKCVSFLKWGHPCHKSKWSLLPPVITFDFVATVSRNLAFTSSILFVIALPVRHRRHLTRTGRPTPCCPPVYNREKHANQKSFAFDKQRRKSGNGGSVFSSVRANVKRSPPLAAH